MICSLTHTHTLLYLPPSSLSFPPLSLDHSLSLSHIHIHTHTHTHTHTNTHTLSLTHSHTIEVFIDEATGLKHYPFELKPIPRVHWEDPMADHLMTHEVNDT